MRTKAATVVHLWTEARNKVLLHLHLILTSNSITPLLRPLLITERTTGGPRSSLGVVRRLWLLQPRLQEKSVTPLQGKRSHPTPRTPQSRKVTPGRALSIDVGQGTTTLTAAPTTTRPPPMISVTSTTQLILSPLERSKITSEGPHTTNNTYTNGSHSRIMGTCRVHTTTTTTMAASMVVSLAF